MKKANCLYKGQGINNSNYFFEFTYLCIREIFYNLRNSEGHSYL